MAARLSMLNSDFACAKQQCAEKEKCELFGMWTLDTDTTKTNQFTVW